MSVQTISPAEQGTEPQPTISDQAEAFATLVALAEAFPGLPAAFVTVYATGGHRVGVQLDSPAAFEVWRAALGIDPVSVTLHRFNGSSWLAGDGSFGGEPVSVTGFGIELSGDQFEAPRAVAV